MKTNTAAKTDSASMTLDEAIRIARARAAATRGAPGYAEHILLTRYGTGNLPLCPRGFLAFTVADAHAVGDQAINAINNGAVDGDDYAYA